MAEPIPAMPHIRPLHQLARYEYETLKVMDVLLEMYPQATGDWGVDSRAPFQSESGNASARDRATASLPLQELAGHASTLEELAR